MKFDERWKTFIGYLLNIAKEGKEDRGALADLRSGLGKEPGKMARVHKHVVPYLPEKNHNDRWYYLTATLFGMHPKHKDPVEHESNGNKWKEVWTMGRAFRPLKEKRNSMEARFVALLNSHPDDLDDHLRHAVRLLKANDQPLDWFQLFEDLLQWDHPDGHVQLQWARDFYKSDFNNRANVPDTDSTLKEEDIDHE
ncbi:MAG: type I-E CRISPR-associated protein Cse2/CasB [Nitrospirae bacterium]|nr:type I-E CRISPR-associated protein Cse2/CasB [Nitrospirota bacterium]